MTINTVGFIQVYKIMSGMGSGLERVVWGLEI